ncbi:uncharacterized protein F4822DRAFT_426190 [Hypoxylon trugodes]|uniref:uncharacterized protein n=1 Tax=Hypoxylon trugodes TaxID=326681 RepID=UPI00219E7E53|nr:uncharacterized protein F4822DRAFT_426190 [Hypoxylon trugodes]KAI1392994.1 hypothetical protein F4822DRAFT_426190 [Hypoxylon trugodes]
MKTFRTTLVLLPLGVASSLPAPSTATRYPPCVSQSSFTIQNWPVDTSDNADFAFRLTTGFDDYSSICSGQWRGVKTDWQECDERNGDSITMFRGTSSGYLDITHQYTCERQDKSAEPDKIALTTANGTVILDFSQEDHTTFDAYIQVSHRKPSTACTDASRDPSWVVDSFVYKVGYYYSLDPYTPAGTVASASFDFLNKANDFFIHCSATYVSGYLDLNNDTIIDPEKD